MMQLIVSRFHLSRESGAEILQIHQMAQDFRREVEHREQCEAYCAWYDQTARQHRQEWATLQQDPYPLRWFWGGRDSD